MSRPSPVRELPHKRFTSNAGRILAVVITAIGVLGEASYLAYGKPRMVEEVTPVFLLVMFAAWMLFWAPLVEVGQSGVRVVNPFRTYAVGWSAITAVETRWALTLVTPHRRIVAWAIPRQTRASAVLTLRRDQYGLPDASAQTQFEQGEPVRSADSEAEVFIARQLNQYRESSHVLDSSDVVSTRLHIIELVVLAVLLMLVVVVAMLAA